MFEIFSFVCLAAFLKDKYDRLTSDGTAGGGEPAVPDPNGVTGEALAGRLRQLAELRANGTYREEECASRKRQMLDDLALATRAGTPEDFLAAIAPLVQAGTVTADEFARVKAFALRA